MAEAGGATPTGLVEVPGPEGGSVQRGSVLKHCDLALAQRLEGAEGRSNADFVDARAKAFPDVGAEWRRISGTFALFDGVGSPCTQTFGLGVFEAPSDAGMEEIETFFRERGSDVFHEVSPLADPTVLQLLSKRGYGPVEWSNVLFQGIGSFQCTDSPSGAGVVVRRIETGGEDLWAKTAACGWSDVAPELEGYFDDLGRVTAHRKNTHCFVAETEGETVAAAALCLADGIALLAGASTMPRWRRRGAQQALLEHRLAFAAERGCDTAMIVALPGSASQRNAERRGFRVAYTRAKWHLGAAPS